MIALVESPYRNGDRGRNLRYLCWCEAYVASLGMSPIASHGNCTAYWPEDDAHRAKGFAWREDVARIADVVLYFVDHGMSSGAALAMSNDAKHGRPVREMRLPSDMYEAFARGELPPGSMRRVPA